MHSWGLEIHNNVAYSQQQNIFADNQIDMIINIAYNANYATPLEKSKIEKKLISNVEDSLRKSYISWIYSYAEENKWLYQILAAHIKNINSNFFKFDLNEIEILQYTEYDCSYNGFFGKHIDMLDVCTNQRKLSFSIQLSNSDEYEGGDLLLHIGQDPIQISRVKGTTVFFPSWTLHEVTPVTKGLRRSLVGWVNGPKFK